MRKPFALLAGIFSATIACGQVPDSSPAPQPSTPDIPTPSYHYVPQPGSEPLTQEQITGQIATYKYNPQPGHGEIGAPGHIIATYDYVPQQGPGPLTQQQINAQIPTYHYNPQPGQGPLTQEQITGQTATYHYNAQPGQAPLTQQQITGQSPTYHYNAQPGQAPLTQEQITGQTQTYHYNQQAGQAPLSQEQVIGQTQSYHYNAQPGQSPLTQEQVTSQTQSYHYNKQPAQELPATKSSVITYQDNPSQPSQASSSKVVSFGSTRPNTTTNVNSESLLDKEARAQRIFRYNAETLGYQLQAIEYEKQANILQGVYDATQTVSGLITGGPKGAVSGLLQQGATLAKIEGWNQTSTALTTTSKGIDVVSAVSDLRSVGQSTSEISSAFQEEGHNLIKDSGLNAFRMNLDSPVSQLYQDITVPAIEGLIQKAEDTESQ
jgi:hypothetical protein